MGGKVLLPKARMLIKAQLPTKWCNRCAGLCLIMHQVGSLGAFLQVTHLWVWAFVNTVGNSSLLGGGRDVELAQMRCSIFDGWSQRTYSQLKPCLKNSRDPSCG